MKKWYVTRMTSGIIDSAWWTYFLSPKIKSVYTVRSHPRTLWRQYYQYGFYKVRVMQKHPRQMRPRQFIPFLLILASTRVRMNNLTLVLGMGGFGWRCGRVPADKSVSLFLDRFPPGLATSFCHYLCYSPLQLRSRFLLSG